MQLICCLGGSTTVKVFRSLVDIGCAVVVTIAGFFFADGSVVAVAQPEHDGGEGGGQYRSGEHADLDVVVAIGAEAVREVTDEQRHGEADACQQRDAEDVDPAQRRVEGGAGERGEKSRGAEDSDGLADDERGDDAQRDGVGHRVDESGASADGDSGGEEREDGDREPADSGRRRCSKCSASPGPACGPPAAALRITGTVNPSSTPATVAWMPDAWTNAQVSEARGRSSHQERTRRCTSTRTAPSGISASSEGERLMSWCRTRRSR